MKKSTVVGVVVAGIVASAAAQDIVIDSISRNGTMSFWGAQVGTTATVEWAASLTDVGRTNWHGLTNVVVTADIMTNDIPVFFRVRGTPDTNLMNGLVAYYPFNGNGADASGNTNNGTLSSASLTTDRFGNPNCAIVITNDYGGATSVANIPISGNADRTISFWCKFSSPTGHQPCVEWGNQSYAGALCGFSENVTQGIWFHGHFADIDFPVSGAPYDQWHHLVFVYHSSLADAVCYADGNVKTRTGGSSGSLNTVATTLRIYGLTGDFIDDVRIYNRALSSNEVTRLHALPY